MAERWERKEKQKRFGVVFDVAEKGARGLIQRYLLFLPDLAHTERLTKTEGNTND